MEKPTQTFKTQTEFNSSLTSLERLHELLIDSNESSKQAYTNQDTKTRIYWLTRWKYNTKAIYREISPKLNKKEKQNINNLYKKYQQATKIIMNKKTPQGAIKLLNPKGFIKQWNITHNIEITLRKAADKRGMLITDKKTYLRGLEKLKQKYGT